MRGIRCLVAAVLAAGIVTIVAAQPGGRQQGGFGQGQDTYMLVLTNKALQEEVKVTDAQKEDFKEISTGQKEATDKVRADFKDKLADAKGDKDKSKDVRAEMGKEYAKISAESRKKLDAKLTGAQKTRLKQITIQAMGIDAFGDPAGKKVAGGGGFGGFGGGFGGGGGFGAGGFSESEKATLKEVGDALKLTDGQKTKIKGLLEEYTKERASISKDVFGDTKGKGGKGGKGRFDPEKTKELRTKTDKLTTETMGKIADTLDSTQKTAWKGLVGDAFDTSKLRPNFQPKKD